MIGKIVSRLEIDSRWALALYVRALVDERDELKEKVEIRQSAISEVGRGPDIALVSRTSLTT